MTAEMERGAMNNEIDIQPDDRDAWDVLLASRPDDDDDDVEMDAEKFEVNN